jgi:hypothetical protein
VALKRGGGRRGRLVPPERVDQAVGGDDHADAAGEERQCGALLRPAEPDRCGVSLGRDRPEQLDTEAGRRGDALTLVDR